MQGKGTANTLMPLGDCFFAYLCILSLWAPQELFNQGDIIASQFAGQCFIFGSKTATQIYMKLKHKTSSKTVKLRSDEFEGTNY